MIDLSNLTQYSTSPRATHVAPNFSLATTNLWHSIAKTLKPFKGMLTPDMSGAADFRYKMGYTVPPDIMRSIISSGPSAAMWGDISGIS